MSRSLERILKVRRQEQPLLLLMVGTIALFQFCQIINENFSETVFLKRLGVAHLPTTYFLNSLVFLALVFAINPVVDRTARTRLVSDLLLVFAGVLVALRLLVLSGLPLAYPVVYIVVKQMKYLFFIVFWTLASDIYSTRKARRLFPLIGGGAVIGTIAGSLSSGWVRAVAGIDNVVLFTGAGMLVSWLLIGLGKRQVSRLSPVAFSPSGTATIASLGRFVRREIFGRRGGSLLNYLILLALLPGIVGPIYDYIFNYLADRTYQSEAALFGFFGLFKGSFNILILACQVTAAGAVFRRHGIVNVLLSFPAGYLFAFGGLLASFRISAAAAGRAGLEAIDAAFYKPGCQMLYNIIPAQLRGRVAALVQGAVRRVGELAGSGLLWVLKSHLSPLQLNVVGPVFALAWLWCTWRLRRSYSDILYRSLSEKHVNFAELEGRDLRSLMSAQARAALEKNLDAARPATALMAARLLSRSGVAGWRALVGARLAGRRPETQAEMLRIVSTGPPDEAAKALLGAAAAVHPSVLPELAALLRRTAPVDGAGLFRKWRSSPDARLAAEALLGLGAPDAEWGMQRLDSKEPGVAAAAVYFLGEAGCRGCLERIAALAGSEAPELRAACAAALGRLGLPRSSERWRLLQADADPRVRLKALEGLAALKDPATVRNAVEALGDEDGAVREGARALIAGHGEAAIPLLTEALPRAGVFTRTALMAMLDDLGVKEQTLLSFIDAKVEEGYRAVAMLRCAEEIPPGRSREVLSLLCRNRLSDATYEVFRALGMLLKGGQVQFIQESYDDRDESVREQALEALENALTPEIARKLLPLLEDLPIDLKLAAGERHYRLGAATIGGILGEMLGSPHGADALCGLMCVGEACRRGRPPAATALRETAERRIAALKIQGGKAVEDLMEKVLTLKGVPIFAHLQFKELLAIASIAREETFDPGDRIIRQGERGHAMYLIVSGKVRILSHAEGDAQEVQLAALGENDYFGEMALFDDSPRSATAVADGPVTALKIEKREFRDMLREYPGVSIMICEEFCRRLRRTIGKVGIQGQLSSND
ncbi:MAG: cyclic nucleotide-binding domain-containing protein [Candidatus Aureabacteria bacterium]|nr:cyclic nucleotide-binding domain-containing protein [Candidatus Auribacterota bacterium]